MQRVFVIGVAIAIVMLSPTVPAVERLQVAVSVPPQQYFLQQIGGELIDVVVLLENGGDPHTYEPGPQQMQSLTDSAIFFAAGLIVEAGWKSHILSAREGMRWVAPDDTQAMDRHFWLSPAGVSLQVERMVEALNVADPTNAKIYSAGGAEFMTLLDALDQEFTTLFSDLDGRNTFLVAHPAWDKFSEAYGLNQIVIEDEGKSLTPRHLAEIIQQAQDLNIQVVFADHGHGLNQAQAIAASLDAELVFLSPVSDNWLSDLRSDAQSIREALR